jgi:phosphomevalonate kinase
VFDRGFLSETPQQRQTQGKFLHYAKGTAKTGLGSSACVVVAIIGGILRELLGEDSPRTLNCLAQVANIAAQNKIGSNFDISAAVFGCQLYTNLLPESAARAVKSGSF